MIADESKNACEKSQSALNRLYQQDNEDKEYITLLQEFRQLLKKSNISDANNSHLSDILSQYQELNEKLNAQQLKNDNLLAKYNGDVKFMRLHKRICERINGKSLSVPEYLLAEQLQKLKQLVDENVQNNQAVVQNQGYFTRMITQQFTNLQYEEFSAEIRDSVEAVINEHNDYIREQYILQLGMPVRKSV
jgi:type I restriction enzyme R subunit